MIRKLDPAHDTNGATASPAGRSVVVSATGVTAEDVAARRTWRELDGPRPALCSLATVAVSGRFLVAERQRDAQAASLAVLRAERRNARKTTRAAVPSPPRKDWRSKPRGFKPGRAGLLAAMRPAPDDPPTAA